MIECTVRETIGTKCGKRFCKGCSADAKICTELRAIEMYVKLRSGVRIW